MESASSGKATVDQVTASERTDIVVGTSAGAALGSVPASKSLTETILQEVKDLEAGGTRTKRVVVGMLPGRKTLSVVDPEIIAPAIQYGYERGMQDLPEMKIFWG